jgi:hypothetical protein
MKPAAEKRRSVAAELAGKVSTARARFAIVPMGELGAKSAHVFDVASVAKAGNVAAVDVDLQLESRQVEKVRRWIARPIFFSVRYELTNEALPGNII